VEEADANQDYNIYSNINARDVSTAGIIVSGANSKVSDSWNKTSWVSGVGGGVTDHGDLTGLGDDDHTLTWRSKAQLMEATINGTKFSDG